MTDDHSGTCVRAPLLLLRLLVAVAGAVSLGLEMCAARLMAPYFGTSLYVWAVLIGLIMIYLTAGYFIGGRWADGYPVPSVLYRLTAFAALCFAAIPPLSGPILSWSVLSFDQVSIGIFLGSLAGVLALFAVPFIALGCVSPFAVRLAITRVEGAGNVAGGMYALSTIGSLVGTFLSVFILIPTIGTRRTLLTLGLALMAISLAGLWRQRPLYLLLFLPLLIQIVLPPGIVRGAHDGRLIYETESAFYYIQVTQSGKTRSLILDEGHAVHSVYTPHRLLTHQYWDAFLLAPLFRPATARGDMRRVAILGLGGGTAARLFAAEYPETRIDGVEIDPAVVTVARRFFGLHEPRLHVYSEDGRYFLLTHPSRYDVIAIDAFHQPYIPFQLTTREFFALTARHLEPGGVVAMNVGRTDADFRLVNTIAATMRAVFHSVFVVDVPGTINSIVFATTESVGDGNAVLHARVGAAPRLSGQVVRWIARRGHLRAAGRTGQVLTDDLAPVERLIDQIILDYIRQS